MSSSSGSSPPSPSSTAEDTVTLKIWIIGSGKPMVFDLPVSEAERAREHIAAAWSDAQPAGSITLSTGMVIRYAAITATTIGPPKARDVARDWARMASRQGMASSPAPSDARVRGQ